MPTFRWSIVATLLLYSSIAIASTPLDPLDPLSTEFSTSNFTRTPGRCAIKGECGRKSAFGGPIPCPYNGLAESVSLQLVLLSSLPLSPPPNHSRRSVQHEEDEVYLATLKQVCGADFDATETCCTIDQLETLSSSLAQADPLISSCPACRTNFRQFYCHFTCSPDQSQFLTVTSTQTLKKDRKDTEAVKSVEFSVSEDYGKGFFDSCKGVKFGATNGYAMDLIGGNSTTKLPFCRENR
jgi:Niemann-Pick C1 protein